MDHHGEDSSAVGGRDAAAALRKLGARPDDVAAAAGLTLAAWWAGADPRAVCRATRVGVAGSPRHRKLIATLCRAARLIVPGLPPGELRPVRAIEVAERWAAGDPGVRPATLRRTAAVAFSGTAAQLCDAAAFNQPWRIAAAAATVIGAGVLTEAADDEAGRAHLLRVIGDLFRADWTLAEWAATPA